MIGQTLIISILLILAGAILSEDLSKCGDWIAFKDEKCFKVFEFLSPESEAENVCQKYEGVLAIIRTQEEQDLVNKYLQSKNMADNVWIGIKMTNNSFKWLDKNEVKYTNWAKDRPLKNSTDMKCVEISVDQSNYGKWIDDRCLRKNAVLCQKIQPWPVERLKSLVLEMRRIQNENKDEILNKLDSQQKLIETQRTQINNLKSNSVPIGFIYTQLSSQPEPKTLWPNTEWENISAKYSGLFFRAEGGQSSLFGQIQEQQMQSFVVQSVGVEKEPGISYWHGPAKISENFELPIFSGSSIGNSDWYGLKFKHSIEEMHPRNQAIRIWKRIK